MSWTYWISIKFSKWNNTTCDWCILLHRKLKNLLLLTDIFMKQMNIWDLFPWLKTEKMAHNIQYYVINKCIELFWTWEIIDLEILSPLVCSNNLFFFGAVSLTLSYFHSIYYIKNNFSVESPGNNFSVHVDESSVGFKFQ